tara:strand:+ start:677 stop:880 length:204 start_codon:yes stop_codon:yes gene_type:complete
MNKYLAFFCLVALSVLTNQTVKACGQSPASLTGITDNGDGTYDLDFQVCFGAPGIGNNSNYLLFPLV